QLVDEQVRPVTGRNHVDRTGRVDGELRSDVRRHLLEQLDHVALLVLVLPQALDGRVVPLGLSTPPVPNERIRSGRTIEATHRLLAMNLDARRGHLSPMACTTVLQSLEVSLERGGDDLRHRLLLSLLRLAKLLGQGLEPLVQLSPAPL